MFSLTTTMNYINQALNYPAATFDDLKIYFDQAISEVNTTLHIGIKSIDTLIKEQHKTFNELQNIVLLEGNKNDNLKIVCLKYAPNPEDPDSPAPKYYYNTELQKFGKLVAQEYVYFDKLYAIYNNENKLSTYESVLISQDIAMFIENIFENPYELDLELYFPKDWIMLFIIPYVCFKYSVRDGNAVTLFMEDASQGFQQLSIAYNVPEFTSLVKEAGNPVYRQDILDNLDNLNVKVPTRAITEKMKVPRDIMFKSNTFYDNGGFWL